MEMLTVAGDSEVRTTGDGSRAGAQQWRDNFPGCPTSLSLVSQARNSIAAAQHHQLSQKSCPDLGNRAGSRGWRFELCPQGAAARRKPWVVCADSDPQNIAKALKSSVRLHEDQREADWLSTAIATRASSSPPIKRPHGEAPRFAHRASRQTRSDHRSLRLAILSQLLRRALLVAGRRAVPLLLNRPRGSSGNRVGFRGSTSNSIIFDGGSRFQRARING